MAPRSNVRAALALGGAALLLLGAGRLVEQQSHDGHQHGAGTEAPARADSLKRGGRMGGVATTITGEVMDPACYLEAGLKSIGPGHFQCAVDCARSGQTLAIYDRENDRIYFIAGELPGRNPNDPVLQFIHKRVDVTGKVYFRSGVYGIVIQAVSLHRGKPAAAAETPSAKAKPAPAGQPVPEGGSKASGK
jgi:hypothetical protein